MKKTSKLGELIRCYRKKHKLTQKQFAELLHKAGGPHAVDTVSRWENGFFTPKGKSVTALSRVLGMYEMELLPYLIEENDIPGPTTINDIDLPIRKLYSTADCKTQFGTYLLENMISHDLTIRDIMLAVDGLPEQLVRNFIEGKSVPNIGVVDKLTAVYHFAPVAIATMLHEDHHKLKFEKEVSK